MSYHACGSCGRILPINYFPIRKGCKNPSSKCSICIADAAAERNRAYRARHKEEINKRLREKRAKLKQTKRY